MMINVIIKMHINTYVVKSCIRVSQVGTLVCSSYRIRVQIILKREAHEMKIFR
jgi:hypothetical protein